MPDSRFSQLARYWQRVPLWVRTGMPSAALFLSLFLFSRVSQPPWPWLPGTPQQQTLANEALGLSLALGIASFICFPALQVLALRRSDDEAHDLTHDATKRGTVARGRRGLVALVYAMLPWCALAVPFFFPATMSVFALIFPLGYLALVLGVGALYVWMLLQLPGAFDAERKHT